MIPKKLIEHIKSAKTPLYFYNMQLLSQTLEQLKTASSKYGYHIHYALKANFNSKILKEISRIGLGADCVSGNEIEKALENGFPAEKIVFAGVGKTNDEILLALKNNIQAFNCESYQEIIIINDLAKKTGRKAKIYLRLNPDIIADTHKNITTGKAENKFGLQPSETEKFLQNRDNLKNIEVEGLHFHVGSQISDMNVFKNLCFKVNKLQNDFYKKGLNIKNLNMGGGLGVDYLNPKENAIPDFQKYFDTFHNHLNLKANQQVHFELGRSIVAQMGTLFSKVLYIKEGFQNPFVIIDASMTDLLRPALYEAFHKIENLSNTNRPKIKSIYDVAGPVCESSDVFARNISLGDTRRGDIIAIYSTGAYGQVMSSSYNLRPAASTLYSDEYLF